jgi:DNA-binding transcriptional ArsR family regulator
VGTYQSTSDALDALGDPTRRAIFERLSRGPCAVGELASGLPVSRPAVSQHLKVLTTAGLVAHRSEGTRHVYRVEPDAVAGLRRYFEHVWTGALSAFKDAAERRPGEGEER